MNVRRPPPPARPNEVACTCRSSFTQLLLCADLPQRLAFDEYIRMFALLHAAYRHRRFASGADGRLVMSDDRFLFRLCDEKARRLDRTRDERARRIMQIVALLHVRNVPLHILRAPSA